MEQTFKVNEFDILSEDDLKTILSDSFLQKAQKRFEEMAISLGEAMKEL